MAVEALARHRLLSGTCILIVEDVYLVARDLARVLTRAGAQILGPAPNGERALALLEQQRPDAAMLDINLGKHDVFPLAGALQSLAIPFIFATGYGAEVVPPMLHPAAILQKPVEAAEVVSTLHRLLRGAA